MWNITRSLTLVAALTVGAASAQPPSPPARKPTMPEFTLIFRPTRPVPPDQLPRRNTAARDWALALRREGKLSFASPLEDEGFTITEKGVTSLNPDRPVGAILVIQAPDLQSAVALAKGHPGLPYGTEIEVRPVKVAPPPPSPR
jgi:hypothetical protein